MNALPSTAGTFASSTDTNNVSIKTTNGTGYDLGIRASVNNSNALNRTGGGSIPSITASVSEANYQDDDYAASNNLNDTWGYKPSKLNSVANSSYLQAPTSNSTSTRIDKTSVANPAVYSITYNQNFLAGTSLEPYTTTIVKGDDKIREVSAASNSLTLYARWKASSNQYCTDWSTCMQNTTSTKPACGTTMTDGRDGATYTTATIN